MQQASGKKPTPHEKRKAKDGEEEDAEEKDRDPKMVRRNNNNSTAADHRQRLALQRQDAHPWDDEETKIFRYCIHFTENRNCLRRMR